MPAARPEWDRFWEKVDVGDCWEWTANRDKRGYGYFARSRVGGLSVRPVPAYRMAWLLLVGPIDDGLELDHQCRNHACVNPDHLEPVTHAENVRRGRAGYHKGNVRVMCKRNLHLLADHAHVRPNGKRYCKPCSKGVVS